MRFGGVVMRIREPRTTALIFRSGKIVCTGSRNEQDSLLAAKKFARIIQKLNFNVSIGLMIRISHVMIIIRITGICVALL